MSVLEDIAAERRRQVEAEGWTPEHDDAHADGELASAAAAYSCSAAGDISLVVGGRPRAVTGILWPWEAAWWKPKSAREDLVRAAALIVAEIERIDRASASR